MVHLKYSYKNVYVRINKAIAANLSNFGLCAIFCKEKHIKMGIRFQFRDLVNYLHNFKWNHIAKRFDLYRFIRKLKWLQWFENSLHSKYFANIFESFDCNVCLIGNIHQT